MIRKLFLSGCEANIVLTSYHPTVHCQHIHFAFFRSVSLLSISLFTNAELWGKPSVLDKAPPKSCHGKFNSIGIPKWGTFIKEGSESHRNGFIGTALLPPGSRHFGSFDSCDGPSCATVIIS